MLTLTYDLGNIKQAAAQFWQVAAKYKTLAFSGEMGAGKTTFIHYICDLLAVEDTVSSPTFALVNEYHFNEAGHGDRTIYHMDWYRLRNMDEALNAGMEDCLIAAIKGTAYCFIEWPEKAEPLLAEPYLWISIKSTDVHQREMEVVLISE